MICETCARDGLTHDGKCRFYSEEGQSFRNRMGYCPIGTVKETRKTSKVRVGQQKQVKRKNR